MEPQKANARNMNKHNVYVKTGQATESQLIASVGLFHTQLCTMFPDEKYEDCEFIVNLVTDKDGNTYKYAYIWVSDTRVYYIMTGLNPDGTERYKTEEETSSKDKIEESLDLDFDFGEMSWETIEEKTVKNAIVVREPLGPILSLPGYEYTPEQIVKVKETLKEKHGTEFDETKVPTAGYFETSRAQAGTVDGDRCAHILRSIVPSWACQNKEDGYPLIRQQFERYSTDEVDPRTNTKPYPRVSVQPFTKKDFETGKIIEDKTKNIVLVEFNRSKNDGIFARQIARKVFFKNPRTGVNEITIWDYLKTFNGSTPPPNVSEGGSRPRNNHNHGGNGGQSGGGNSRSNFGFKRGGGGCGDDSSFFDRTKKK